MNPTRRFTLISWGLTLFLVLGAGAFTYWRMQTPPKTVVVVQPQSTQPASGPTVVASIPQSAANISMLALPAMGRGLVLKTVIPTRPRYDILEHTVERGDSVFGISKQFSIKPDSLLWANYDLLSDSPDSLRPGQELSIPPTDGILYKWKKGDTLVSVAGQYKAKVEDIVNWPGNNVDLTNPTFKPGQEVMIPGGWRESKAMTLPTITRGRGTGTSNVGSSACGAGGAVGSGGFIFPTANHFISGNDYYAGHLGIDLAIGLGEPVYAADSGVVTMANGGWNGGYGNVIMIDHGNGYATLYAHLSVINVSVCQSVGKGQVIAAAGSTGNSTGAHLHFEVRKGGSNIDPWYVLGQ